MKRILFYFFLLLFIGATYSYNRQVEQSKAEARLSKGYEVYVSFYRDSRLPLQAFSDVFSIDKVENDIVYAYLPTQEKYDNFLSWNIDFTVETNPSELIRVECSDYANFRSTDRIDKYPTYEGYLNLVRQFEKDNPNLCKVFDMGKSERGKEVIGLIITAPNKKPKSRVLWLGSVHGDELTGAMTSFRMFQYLIDRYKNGDERITTILENTEIWTAPFENPDGTWARGNHTVNGATRTNANRVDLNRSFDTPPGAQKAGREQQETRNVYKLIKDHIFSFGADSHGGIECYIYPWCCKSETHPQRLMYRTIGTHLINETVGGIEKGMGNAMETVGYLAKGCQADYLDYYGHMVGWTFELSKTKLIPESQFDFYWDKFREMMLSYYELGQIGIQGVVTDYVTKQGIDSVEVSIEGETENYLKRYSYNGGFYCRVIKAGTYKITFSREGYHPKTYEVTAQDMKKTPLDVILNPIGTAITEKNNIAPTLFKAEQKHGKMTFAFGTKNTVSDIKIYKTNGTLVASLKANQWSRAIWNFNNSKGTYIIKASLKNSSIVKQFTIH